MRCDRTVIAYHGYDADTAELLLRGEPFKKSQNDYDWLGDGRTAPTARFSSRVTNSSGAS